MSCSSIHNESGCIAKRPILRSLAISLLETLHAKK